MFMWYVYHFIYLYIINSLYNKCTYLILSDKKSTIFIRTAFVMALCLILRCISFLSTSLPAPAQHCQSDYPLYQQNKPKTIIDILFRVDGFHGCGDLIFSSHTSLSLCLVLTFYVYSPMVFSKKISRIISFCILFPMFITMCIFIIGARKHYTVDIIVAIYVTPMVYYTSYYFMKDTHCNIDSMDTSSEYTVTNVQQVEIPDILVNSTINTAEISETR